MMSTPGLCRVTRATLKKPCLGGISQPHCQRKLQIRESHERRVREEKDPIRAWNPSDNFDSSVISNVDSDAQKPRPDHLKISNLKFPIGDPARNRHDSENFSIVKKYDPTVDSTTQLARDMLSSHSALHVQLGGVSYDFDPIFLRDSCRCQACRDPDSGQKKFDTCDIPYKIQIESISKDPAGNPTITWRDDVEGYGSDHKTTFGTESLRRLVDPAERTEPNWYSSWNANAYEKRFQMFDYHDFMTHTKTTLDVLRRLQHSGLAFLRNVPENERSVNHIGERLGPLRETFYGRTWDVKDKPSAENVAYTSQHLGLHMDLLYMQNPPGFQLLHCIEASDSGGVSMFADAYRAAETIEYVSPQAFNALATFPVAYQYVKGGQSYRDEKPVFELSPQVHPSSRLPLSRRLKAVNWSPPFQGPLRHTIGLDEERSSLRAWIRAAKAFNKLISSDVSMFCRKMEPGECVIFNNRRILHGRTSFKGEPDMSRKPRWLKGAYLDTDVFQSACSRFAHQAKREFVANNTGRSIPAREDPLLSELKRLDREAAVDIEEGHLFAKGFEKGSSSDILARMFNI